MERLVPPHAPVGPFNASALPIRWEFPRYTSFQSRQPQKCSFIFLLKSITNLEQGVEQSGYSAGFLPSGVCAQRQQETQILQMVPVTFFQPTGDYFKAENTRVKANSRHLLTDRQQLQLPGRTALFRGFWKLPSSLFLKLAPVRESNVLT